MKTASFFLTVCLVLMAAGTVHAAVYTEANAYWGNATDSGFKPYSSVDYTSSYFQMSATAEADNNWLKGISQADVIAEATNEGNAETISRFTTTFEVISDGLVSFDYLLDGEMEIYLHSPGTSTIPFTAYYALSVSDSISSDSVNVSDTLFEYEVGTYVLPVDLIDTYQFGGTSYAAGTLIDVTLELQTYANAGYGYGVGSFAKSDFSNSLTFDNLVNLQVVPEPTSFVLLLLGGIGLRQLRRR